MNDARGYLYVLKNRNFLVLWLAQIFSLIALNSSLFVTIILIEKASGSSTQNAAVIAAFSLPAVFLSAIAGFVVDRIPKKRILVVSNALRVFTQLLLALLAGLALDNRIDTGWFAILIYILIFISSAVGQFFAPAEGSTIPMLVGREGLLAANSLFTLTVVASQVAALVVIVPVAVKTLGVIDTLVLLAAFYVGATLLVMMLPRDKVVSRPSTESRSILQLAWQEVVEGWQFSIRHRPILVGILQIGLVGILVFVMADLAPGYAKRVLGLEPEDSIFIFSPAGIGMLIASGLVVRTGPRFRRHTLPVLGMILMGLSLLGLGLVGRLGNGTSAPLFHIRPELTVSATTLIGICSFVAGIALALIMIPAQTLVQEEASDELRGRVLTVQFTLANAVSVIPLLTFGGLADIFGIPTVTMALALGVLGVAVLNYVYSRTALERPRKKFVAEALPLAGADPSTVRSDDDADVRYTLRSNGSADVPEPKASEQTDAPR